MAVVGRDRVTLAAKVARGCPMMTYCVLAASSISAHALALAVPLL